MNQKLNIQQIRSIFIYKLFPPHCFLLINTSFTLNVVVLPSIIMFSENAMTKENLWEYWKRCTYHKPNINVYA